MSKIILFLILISCASHSSDLTLIRSIDGDSFVLGSGKLHSEVRLYGVDCPEIFIDKKNKKLGKNPLGLAAKEHLEKLIGEQGLKDFKQVTIDYFNRPLVIVVTEKSTLNELMIESGICKFYERAQSYQDNSFRSKLKRLSEANICKKNPKCKG